MANEKEINLITGERGFSHVTSEDARVQNRLTYGSGRHFLKYGKEFDFATIDTNTIRIYDGAAYNQGAFIKIDRDNYADVTVDNGLQGLKRSDLIVLRYKRNLYTQLESASVVVLKGESTEGTPVDPEYAVGDIAQGESVDEIPMYRINFTGVKFTIEKLFSTEERSLTIVENTMNNHISDGGIHIKPTERTNWNDANSKKHTHSNKSILDKITQTLLNNWSAAYTHISDAVKHITADERTKWNKAASPVDNLNETTTGKSLDAHQGYVLNEAISTNSYGEYAGGKNLFDKNNYNAGYCIYNGEYQAKTWGSCSYPIPVEPNTTYYLSHVLGLTALQSGSYLDENKNYISAFNKSGGDDISFAITTPSNARYIVVNMVNDNIDSCQVELGTTATPYEPYIKSNYQLGNDKADKSEVCVNLLKPIGESIKRDGITITKNEDGTYTVSGTATADVLHHIFTLNISKNIDRTLRLVGCPKNGSESTYFMTATDNQNTASATTDVGNGKTKTIKQWGTSNSWKVFIVVKSGTTLTDVVFKPMLTTDLSATYDDFVPYTGDKGRINEEVAELNKKVTGMFTLDGTTLNITTE